MVADFGIALAVGAAGGARLTETGLSLGTPYYMSPEQATGDQVVGPRSDTYALACVLYEMLAGEPPYPGATAQAVLGKILQGSPVSARAHRPAVPLHVDAAIRKGLERLPADRFERASDFARSLADKGFRYGEGSAVPVGSLGPWKAGALGAVIAAVLALGALTWMARSSGSEPAVAVERHVVGFVPGQEALYVGGPGALALSPDGSFRFYLGPGV